MKIAVVSKADVNSGGASRVAGDVATQMRLRGHEVTHFTAWPTKETSLEIQCINGGWLSSRIFVNAAKVCRKLGFGELIPLEAGNAIRKLSKFDIVHFHDTSTAFSPWTIRQIAKRTKVFWTFHDCSPFTGGCIYPQMGNCEQYKAACGKCALQGEWPIDGYLNTTRWALRSRKKLHREKNITYITPSRWMSELAYYSGNVSDRPNVISNMIDTDVFHPINDISKLKRNLQIPEDRLVVALSSGNISDPRKDIASSLEIIRALNDRHVKVHVILLGKADAGIGSLLKDIDFTATGYVYNRHHLNEWLNVSDLFLTTTRADNQPLAIMEALSAGVPVYASNVGGIPEMIDAEETGRLFTLQHRGMIASQIASDRVSGLLTRMRKNAREYAENRFNAADFADRHEKIFKGESF